MAEVQPIPNHHRSKDLTGRRFGRLVVTAYTGRRGHNSSWNCCCDCGTIMNSLGSNLLSGHTASCGCLKDELIAKLNVTHGLTKSPWKRVVQIWHAMIRRCTKQASKNHHRYGGRGILVCERWLVVENFLADMGMPPTAQHEIDRIDNDGNYEPGNCRWATRKEQTRNSSANHRLTFDGRTQCIAEWADELGISYTTISGRLQRGWTDQEALSIPVRFRRRSG